MVHRVAFIILSLAFPCSVDGLFDCPALPDLTDDFKTLLSTGEETRTMTYTAQMQLGQNAKKDDLISLEGRMPGLCLSAFPTLASDSQESKADLRRVVTFLHDNKRDVAALTTTVSALPGIVSAQDETKRDIAALSTTLNAQKGIISALLDDKERNEERRESVSAAKGLMDDAVAHEHTVNAFKKEFVQHSQVANGGAYIAAGHAALVVKTSLQEGLDTQKQDVRFMLETNKSEVKSGMEIWMYWGASCALLFLFGVAFALVPLYFEKLHSSRSAAAPEVVSQSPVSGSRIDLCERIFAEDQVMRDAQRSEAAAAKEAARFQEDITVMIKQVKYEMEKMSNTSPETAVAATQELKIDQLIAMAAGGEVAATGHQEILSKLDEVHEKLSSKNAAADAEDQVMRAVAKEAARVQEETTAECRKLKDSIEKMMNTSPETAAAATQELKIDHSMEMPASGEVAATGHQEILSKLDELCEKFSSKNADALAVMIPSSTVLTTCMAQVFLQTDAIKTRALIVSSAKQMRDEHAAEMENMGLRVSQLVKNMLHAFGEVQSHNATLSRELIEAKRPSLCEKIKETYQHAVSHHASSSKDQAGSHHASSSSSSGHSP